MKLNDPLNPRRRCTKCKQWKLIKGGTSNMGRNFRCKECKESKP